MPQVRPPRLATWLLQRFGKAGTTEAILGDLTERYQAGESRFWYWKQVAIAIFACARCDLQAYAFGAAVALITQVVSAVESWQRGQLSFFAGLSSPGLMAAIIYFAVRSWRRCGRDQVWIKPVLRRMALMTGLISALAHIAICLWWFTLSGKARLLSFLGALGLAIPIAGIGFVSVYLLVMTVGRLAMRGSGSRQVDNCR